jgi:hypothetical protein
MAQFDTGLADRLWEGLPPPGDAPEWYGKVSTLIRAASAPAGPSDLAGEASIVARMQAAVVDDAADTPRAIDLRHAVVGRRAVDSPRHLAARRRAAQREQGHGARLVGRIVAVKAVALSTAVVLGVTAAAATTGIVATVVVPALQHRDQRSVEELPAIVVDQGGGSSSGPESPGGSSGSWRPDCVLRLETCGRDGAGEGLNPGATGDDPADAATASGAAVSDATGEAVGDARTATTVPPADEAPAETTTTTTQPPSTTTTSQPPPTTTTTQPPAPLVGTSAGADAVTPPPAAIVG